MYCKLKYNESYHANPRSYLMLKTKNMKNDDMKISSVFVIIVKTGNSASFRIPEYV